ncbi:MAG: extracellular solute-binding protein, partial [Clostridia bacterium]|nr:extracellular solute-binding protein [Clostridia bacterium]
MTKRIFVAALAAVALFAFSSCKEEKPINDTQVSTGNEAVSSEEGEFDYDAHLSSERYDGYNYRILVRKGYTNTQYLEEDSEDNVESAVYRRNKEVEAKYGITITASESSSGGYETTALNSILAGDDAYDIIFSHSRAAFTYAVQGAAYNINDISTINLSNPWWSQDIKNSCDINGYEYVLDGDI